MKIHNPQSPIRNSGQGSDKMQSQCNQSGTLPVKVSVPPADTKTNLKKFAAIIFFATLFVAQYARYGGYVECRFSNWVANNFSPSPAKCDCDKWLANVTTGDTQPPIPFHHQHYHLDELFIIMEDSSSDSAFFINTGFSYLISSLQDGVYPSTYRPPAEVMPC